MSNNPAVTETPFWTAEQRELAIKLFCKDLPEDATLHFIAFCERMKLDPFAKQVYARAQRVKKGKGQNEHWTDELVIITGIDGLRSLAERTKEYRGQTEPEWFYLQDGDTEAKWQNVWFGLGRGPKVPEAARIGIYRKGFEHPVWGVAHYESFAQFTKDEKGRLYPTTFWKKMPEVMLSKIAEAQALRKAFPMVLGGIYIEEEVPENETSEEDRLAAESARKAELEAKLAQRVSVAANKGEKPKEEPPLTEPEPTPQQASATEPAPPPRQPISAWKLHVLKFVPIAEVKDRKLGDLSVEEIGKLMKKWVKPYADKIALSAGKTADSDAIKAAYEELQPLD